MRRACQFVLLGIVSLLGQTGAHAQVSFYTAVDLALRNSTPVRISAADVQHAEAAVMESVDAYKPSFSVGSSLGYSYGFPVGQPSVYSVAAQSLAFSFSQPDYIRSARAALLAAQLQLKDTRQQVILDTALDYIELVTVNQQITALDQETGFVQRLVEIETQRVDAGLDSKVELTQARLTGAQIALRRLHLVDQADLVRLRLAHLTGLNPGDIVSEPQTIPTAPGGFGPGGIDGNTGIKAAYASARSKMYNAFGDARQTTAPPLALAWSTTGTQNSITTTSTTCAFNTTTSTSAFRSRSAVRRDPQSQGEGFQCRGGAGKRPSRSIARSDRGAGAAIAENRSRAYGQEQVAELQNELAQDQLDAITTQIRLGSGSPGGAAPLPKDEQGARIRERSHFVDMLETRFQLTQARLSLLRSLGRIEDWAKATPTPHP